MSTATQFATRLVRSQSPEAETITGYRRSARHHKVRQGLLPPPIALGPRATAFIASELEAITAARAAGAGDDQIRDLVKQLVAARAGGITRAG